MGKMVKKKAPKTRSFQAIRAWNRSGAGVHKDKKVDADRDSCKKEFWVDELLDLAEENFDIDDEDFSDGD